MNDFFATRARAMWMPVAVVTVFGMQACSSNTGRGAAAGAAAGAVVGGVIGNNTGSGSTTKGAIIGAVIGGAAGAAIGRQMDKQAEEIEDEVDGATVERVGEGINVTFDSGILFDVDSDVLRMASRRNLDELAESLQEYPGTRVLIAGHTDATGSESYNQRLSERRADSARQYLVQQGIASSRIESVGRGELEPVATNETASGRQQNRRVEVAIFASEEMQEAMLERYGRS